jgi:diaminohydroxyphosphoribosylaminopyrimidine deaminase/5-amino-6-(5-phosphoribosylamino)uracil reductase
LVAAGAFVHTLEVTTEGRLDIRAVLSHLGAHGINSVLVEGGAAVHGSMLTHSLVDEIYLFTAPFFIGEQGTPLLASFFLSSDKTGPRLENMDCRMLGDDLLVHGFVQHGQTG